MEYKVYVEVASKDLPFTFAKVGLTHGETVKADDLATLQRELKALADMKIEQLITDLRRVSDGR